MRRNNPFALTVVPAHRELDRGTLRAILRHTDIGVEDYIRGVEIRCGYGRPLRIPLGCPVWTRDRLRVALRRREKQGKVLPYG
jgi:hypothetical protein